MTPGVLLSPARPFSVMVKPVGSHCNLACSYCYYLETPRDDPALRQPRMSDELLERFTRQYLEASPGPEVSFVWHGGEPALAGLDFYRRALELQQRYLPAGWTCWNNLQTNGTLLDDEWCSFLAQAHFDVGLSIDGTRAIHDHYRTDRSGAGTYAEVVATCRRLQAHGLQPDLLCTVTARTAARPRDVYRALRDLGTGWIQFIPIVQRDQSAPAGVAVTPDSVSPEGYGDFLCAVFDEWVRRDLRRLDVQMFSETARIWMGGAAGLCWMAPTCGRALIVEVDGGVYSCDHFVTPGHRLGDLQTARLGDLANSPAQLRFGEEKRTALPRQCRECAWLTVCNGGCPKDRFMRTEEGEPGLNYLCPGFKRFFAHAHARLTH